MENSICIVFRPPWVPHIVQEFPGYTRTFSQRRDRFFLVKCQVFPTAPWSPRPRWLQIVSNFTVLHVEHMATGMGKRWQVLTGQVWQIPWLWWVLHGFTMFYENFSRNTAWKCWATPSVFRQKQTCPLPPSASCCHKFQERVMIGDGSTSLGHSMIGKQEPERERSGELASSDLRGAGSGASFSCRE